MRPHDPRSGHNSVMRNCFIAKIDVRRNIAREEEHVLQDHCDVPPEILLPDALDVYAVHEDLPPLDVVQPGEQADDRCFPGSRVSDERRGLPRPDGKRHILQHPGRLGRFFVGIVRKPHMAEFDVAADRRECHRIVVIPHQRGIVQKLEHAFRRRHCRLHDVVFVGEIPDRPPEHLVELEKGHHGPDGHGAAERLDTRIPHNEPNSDRADQVNARIEDCIVENRLDVGVPMEPVDYLEALV